MTTQRSLFDPSTDNGTAAAFRKRSDTSKAAAALVNETLTERQQRVLEYIRAHGSATCKEVLRAFGGTGLNAWSGRFSELQHRLGKIEPTGDVRDGCKAYRIRRAA